MDEHSSQETKSLIDAFTREPSPLRSDIPVEFTDQEKQQISLIFNSNMYSHPNKETEHHQLIFHASDVLSEKINPFVFEDDESEDENENENENENQDDEALPFDLFYFTGEKSKFYEQLENFVDERISDEEFSSEQSAEEKHQDYSAKATVKATGNERPLVNTQRENSIPCTSITQQDVLFGRGERINNHEGNQYFRRMVSSMTSKYKNCPRSDKADIANSIVAVIHQRGGRFLAPIPNSNLWNIVEGSVIRSKTSHALRDSVQRFKKRNRSSFMNVRRENAISHRSITQQDVLLGRGYVSNNHEGNQYFRRMVASMASKYKSCSKSDKADIANSIVDNIRQRGGRFLAPIPNSQSWDIVEGRVIRRKTSRALRDNILIAKTSRAQHDNILVPKTSRALRENILVAKQA